MDGDTQAKKEESIWDIERENYHRWLRIYGFIPPTFLIVFTGLFLFSLLSWTLHYLFPIGWHWLDAAQLSKIQSVIFSGSLGAITSFIFKKQVSKSA